MSHKAVRKCRSALRVRQANQAEVVREEWGIGNYVVDFLRRPTQIGSMYLHIIEFRSMKKRKFSLAAFRQFKFSESSNYTIYNCGRGLKSVSIKCRLDEFVKLSPGCPNGSKLPSPVFEFFTVIR